MNKPGADLFRATRNMLPISRQVVADLVPWRLGADEDMSGGPDRGRIDKRSHRDMDEGAVAHHGIEQRAAAAAVCVMGLVVAVNQQTIPAPGDAELLARNSGERLERRAGGAPAIRAMAIQGVGEFVSHGVADRAAKAFSGKNASIRFC